MAEPSAVNRIVVSSNLTCGAKFWKRFRIIICLYSKILIYNLISTLKNKQWFYMSYGFNVVIERIGCKI